MNWMVAPLRLSLSRWRLLLLAAFVLLAGAMGGGDAVARAGIGRIVGECPVSGTCDQRLTAPAQPALIQVALRIDGKALTGGGAGLAALPGGNGLPAFIQTGMPAEKGVPAPLPRKAISAPGQPRGPPAGH